MNILDTHQEDSLSTTYNWNRLHHGCPSGRVHWLKHPRRRQFRCPPSSARDQYILWYVPETHSITTSPPVECIKTFKSFPSPLAITSAITTPKWSPRIPFVPYACSDRSNQLYLPLPSHLRGRWARNFCTHWLINCPTTYFSDISPILSKRWYTFPYTSRSTNYTAHGFPNA